MTIDDLTESVCAHCGTDALLHRPVGLLVDGAWCGEIVCEGCVPIGGESDVVCARCGTSEDLCADESVLCERCQHPDHVRTLRFWAAMYDPDEPVGIYQPDADYYHALSAFDLRWAADEMERLQAALSKENPC